MSSYLEFLSRHADQLVNGTAITLAQFVLSALVAITLAVIAGLLTLAPSRPLKAVAAVYIEIFRGTSLLVQLYWIYFVLPLMGLELPKFVAGFVTVGAC
ncbi:MAG: ABC transporter permease subunit, partial [Cereibacter changlensis]